MLHPPKSRAFNREEAGVGLGDDMTDGARKHQTQPQMKAQSMINGDWYRTQRIKDHRLLISGSLNVMRCGTCCLVIENRSFLSN